MFWILAGPWLGVLLTLMLLGGAVWLANHAVNGPSDVQKPHAQAVARTDFRLGGAARVGAITRHPQGRNLRRPPRQGGPQTPAHQLRRAGACIQHSRPSGPTPPAS